MDFFFILFGALLAFATVAERLYKLFGFLQSEFGAGLFLIFAGFLVVKAWDLTQFQTWVGIISFGSGFLFIGDSVSQVLCSTVEKTELKDEQSQSLIPKDTDEEVVDDNKDNAV